MERSRGLLLVAGLLAALLPAAAAAFGPQPGAPCEPTLLAPQVALFCAPDFSTQCCEPVVPAVNLSGCVPCVCRVPAEPQLVMAGLNATHFLTPYSSCGGLHPGGAHLAAACEDARPPQQQYCTASTCGGVRPGAHPAFACKVVGHAPLGAVFGSFTRPSPPRRKLQELKCDPFSLGSKLVSACGDDQHPSLPCCEFIINTVDEYCVCDVIEVTEVTSAGISVSMIWTFYSICGGTRPIPADTTVCHEQSPPPPPPVSPPPPPPSPGPPASTGDSVLKRCMDTISHALTEAVVGSYAMSGLLVVSVGTGIAVWVWKKYSDKNREPAHLHGELELQPVRAGQQSTIIGTGAARLRRPMTSAQTTVPSTPSIPAATASAPSIPAATASAPSIPAASAPPELLSAPAPRLAILE
ncbi:hypothetical protein VPH35_076245 [Triticum aestivum]|uniref:uncharacterized protein n=1 Tax=Triticum aestivum TaxID=4565 RepID=UPI000843B598|nr:uncharacterized protein LOC123099383 [Triticum aestivum]